MTIKFLKAEIKDYTSITAQILTAYQPGIFQIVDQVKSTDLIGVTIYDYTSMPKLVRIRKMFPDHKIIAGGIGVYGLYHRILHSGLADMVYMGEALPFDPSYIYTREDIGRDVAINQDIDFSGIPVMRAKQKNYYLLVEKGCPFGCEFCYVSAVNQFKKMSNEDFHRKIDFIDRKLKGNQVTLISNEGIVKELNGHIFEKYTNNHYDNQSIPITTYMKKPEWFSKQNINRFGIELPTEELRARILPRKKRIPDLVIQEFLSKYMPKGITTFFYVWAYVGTTINDYKGIVHLVRKWKNPKKMLRLSFTTLEISPYTKLVPRLNEHIDTLLDFPDMYSSSLTKEMQNLSNIKVLKSAKSTTVLDQYMYTFLPHQYQVRKPKTGEGTREYLKRIAGINGISVSELRSQMQAQALRMVMSKKKDTIKLI